jgi:hypothetical protein
MGRRRGLDPKPLLPFIKEYSGSQIGGWLGLHRSTVNLWKEGKRGISLENADKLACHLGIHPWLIWGDEYAVSVGLPSYIFKTKQARGRFLGNTPPGLAQGDQLNPVPSKGR